MNRKFSLIAGLLCSWFVMTSSKIEINGFWIKFLHNINNPVLKDLCKFQVDTPINAKVKAV